MIAHNEKDMANEGKLLKRRKEFEKNYNPINLRKEIDKNREYINKILEKMVIE